MLSISKYLILFGAICPIIIKAVPRLPINSDFLNGQWARIGKRNQQTDAYTIKDKILQSFVSDSLENFCSEKAYQSKDQANFEIYFESNYFIVKLFFKKN